MNKNWVWILATLIPVAARAQDTLQRQKLDGIAAVVGRQIVLDSDVQQLLYQARSSDALGQANACDALGDLMMKKLLVNQAELDSVQVDPARIERAARMRLDAMVKQSGVPERQILNFYNKTASELIVTIAHIFREQEFTQRETEKILKDVDVSPQEIKAYYDSIPKAELPEIDEEAELSSIVKYPLINQASKQEVIDQLKAIKREVEREGPDSFRAKAVIYSEDPGSASKGGEYKGVKRGKFVKEFEAVAFNMAEGQISEPFETKFGFHIIQLLKRRGEQLDLRHILIKVKPTREALDRTRHYLDSIKGPIQKGVMSFEEAARRFSDDPLTRRNGGRLSDPKTGLNRIPFSEMQADRYLAVKDLKKAALSDPSCGDFNGRKACFLYEMNDRFPPHKLNYAMDFQRLKSKALAREKVKKLSDWRKSKTPDTFIELSDSYKDCPKLQSWLQR